MSHRTIWKYTIPVEDEFTVEMPRTRTLLNVATQRDVPQMWFLVDSESGYERVTFRVLGTGHVITDWKPLDYLGTFQQHDGALVFHVFEKKSCICTMSPNYPPPSPECPVHGDAKKDA